MKTIILLCTFYLSSLTGVSQRDFDYSFFTTKETYKSIDTTKDGIPFPIYGGKLYTMVKKEGSTLTITDLENPGDVYKYTLFFVGTNVNYPIKDLTFLYGVADEEQITIYINPMLPYLRVQYNDYNILRIYQ